MNLPREARAFLQRARILDATARSVAQLGYAKTTVSEIHGRAGVSRRTFYDAFADKEEAVVEAFDVAAAFAVPQIADALRGARGWAARVDEALTTYLTVLDCDRDWATLCLVGLPAAGERALAHRDEILAPLAAALAPGRGSQAAAAGAIAAIDSALRARLHDRSQPLLAARPELLTLALTPFGGPAAARRRAERGGAPARLHGTRAAEVRAQAAGDGSMRELVARAVAERDGPALWRAIVDLDERRLAGVEVDVAIERDALRGLSGAWFFGLPVGDVAAGAAPQWLPASPRDRCLRLVCADPGATAREVRAALGDPHHSTVYRLLAELEEAGLVERCSDSSRAVRWRCTDAGAAAAQKARPWSLRNHRLPLRLTKRDAAD